MILRKLFFISLFISFSMASSAEIVSKESAQKAATHFYFEKQNQFGQSIDLDDILISNIYTKKINGIPVFYAFDMNEGYVIVSAEDAYTPIIGYSYQGKFRIEDAPEHIISFFDSYAAQIEYSRSYGLQAEPDVKSDWIRLLTNDPEALNTSRSNRDVEPLITAICN